jgi:hypothetical protein
VIFKRIPAQFPLSGFKKKEKEIKKNKNFI